MNLLLRRKISGLILPAATALSFGTMLLTIGYMDRLLSKKVNLDMRIATEKARLNAESGVSITIGGPADTFAPGLASADWPSQIDDFEYDLEGHVDDYTFPSIYKPENTNQIFPNANLSNSPNINMGKIKNITLGAGINETTRRPERIGSATGVAEYNTVYGGTQQVEYSSRMVFTVDVLSDFMYLTHHEFAGGAPGVFGGDPYVPSFPKHRRQPCFGENDAVGFISSGSTIGFVQTLDAMRFCTNPPTFNSLVYVSEATNTDNTNPPYWVNANNPGDCCDYNWTNVIEGNPILPYGNTTGPFNFPGGIGVGLNHPSGACGASAGEDACGWEMKDPVCFPVKGYKETVLSATQEHTYDATEMLEKSKGIGLKDTLIMTDIEFHADGGYTATRWWYLMPPYLRADLFDLCGPNADCDSDGQSDYVFSKPYTLESWPINLAGPTSQANVINAVQNVLCVGENDNGEDWRDITLCNQYTEPLHDFSSILIKEDGTEVFNTFFERGTNSNCVNGGGVTRLSHFDIENFNKTPQRYNLNVNSGYFEDKFALAGFGGAIDGKASKNWNLEELHYQGGGVDIDTGEPWVANILTKDRYIPNGQDEKIIIYVKGGPVRVHGIYKGAYTVVTSGWDSQNGADNGLSPCDSDEFPGSTIECGGNPGPAGYYGWNTYHRHAWRDNNAPIDTLRSNIWITADLVNADTGSECIEAPILNNGPSYCPPQPCLVDDSNENICDYEEPGDCQSSKNVMGLVSAANVIIANSPENREIGASTAYNAGQGINIHASIIALNESFVMHYWQHGLIDGACGGPPYDIQNSIGLVNDYPPNGIGPNCNSNTTASECMQTPPHADGRGRSIWGSEPNYAGNYGRGYIRLCGGVVQKFRGYMTRDQYGNGNYANFAPLGMEKDYSFDNNLYFPPPGAITITECENSVVRMTLNEFGRLQ